MSNASKVDELDNNIEALLTRADAEPPVSDPALRELFAVASGLRTLPDPDFKARLKADLIEQAEQGASSVARIDSRLVTRTFAVSARRVSAPRSSEILPTLFGAGYGAYPVQRSSFIASALAHTTALALLVTAGIWAARDAHEVPKVSSVVLTDLSPYILPPAPDQAGGGGGGGDRQKLQASEGHPPRFAPEQITPPAIVVGSEQPRLTADPTVVGPPSLFPQTGPMGDPLSGILGPPSNGTGNGGGLGNGSGGGDGIGEGPGVGAGRGGGFGTGPYRVGGGVSAPHAIYDPEPEYSEEARKAKYQGVVVLQVVIGADGRPRDIRVARTLGMGLDQKAIDAVRQWRFEPALRERQPVAVVVNIEVNFRLY
jgi:periplasmic protein TonB